MLREREGQTHTRMQQDFKGSFDEIFAKFQLPDEPSFYIHVPSRCDPSAAPATCDSLMVLVPCGHLRQPSRSGGSSWPQDAHSAQVCVCVGSTWVLGHAVA